MQRYFIVLFKNKVKKKIIKKFVTLEKAKKYYEYILGLSENVTFNTIIENTKEVKYEIALLDSAPTEFNQVYLTDSFGRSVKIKTEDKKYSILKIGEYKKEESLFDLKENKKITFDKLLTKYLRNQNLKMVYVLNNKIIIQDDDTVNLFSLKTENEAMRFIDCLSDYFLKNKRSDCLFIKDNSTPQKKYLYSLLENKGYDKKVLYRKSTTYQPRVHLK